MFGKTKNIFPARFMDPGQRTSLHRRDTAGHFCLLLPSKIVMAILLFLIFPGVARGLQKAVSSQNQDLSRPPEEYSSHSGSAATPSGEDNGEAGTVFLRQQLINFLQSENRIDIIPPSHPLYPLARIPLLATTSYILMEQDNSLLDRFYPNIRERVIKIFSTRKTRSSGLITGSAVDQDDGRILFCPSVNALADLELHMLSLMATRTGRFQDAIEIKQWARDLSDEILNTFYNSRRNFLFPVDREWHFVIRYYPEQILPLLICDNTGPDVTAYIIRKLLYHNNISPPRTESALNNPFLRPTLISLLECFPQISGEQLKAIRSLNIASDSSVKTTENIRHWIEFWESGVSLRETILPPRSHLACLVNTIYLLQDQSLMESDKLQYLTSGMEMVISHLEKDELDLHSYRELMTGINGLLAKISSISTNIASEKNRWKEIDDYRWKDISPRARKLLIRSSSEAVTELRRIKCRFAAPLDRATGLYTDLRLPEKSARIGDPVYFKGVIGSRRDTLSISKLFAQVEQNRWKITAEDERIILIPGQNPYTFQRKIPLGPDARPGLIHLTSFFDFKVEGERVEIHHHSSLPITEGYDLSLNLPEGKKLNQHSKPIQIVLRYTPSHNVRGTVEGSFLDDMICKPELPAGFLVKKGDNITTLPLAVSYPPSLAPGEYPFSLLVKLNGRPIASFEDKFIKPFSWFYLGPLARSSYIMENALDYQDDLFATYSSPGGMDIRWRELASGAIDKNGSVLPARLIGEKDNRCLLLFTAIRISPRRKVRWHMESYNETSLWINGVRTATGDRDEYSWTGKSDLRNGTNFILISTCWDETPHPVSFEITDDNGMPVKEIDNRVENIIDNVDRLFSADEDGGSTIPSSEEPKEVVLALNRPDANKVNVIGSFNNWDPSATPMKKGPEGTWRTTLYLPPGKYSYKFLIDDNTRITDPSAGRNEPDGFGGYNSILIVK